MAERPIFHKEFGLYLAGLRDGKGWTKAQAVLEAEKRSLKGFTRNVLNQLEAGGTKAPKAKVLRAPVEGLLQAYRTAKFLGCIKP